MNLSAANLNLLIVLESVVRTGSVVAASVELGRSQPATSHALAQLRVMLDDPLFVRVGRRLRPTARLAALMPELERFVAGARRVLSPPERFDPARLSGTLRIATADYGALVVLPTLLVRLREQAPGVTVSAVFVGDRVDDAVRDGEVDLAVLASPRALPGLVSQRLLRDENVAVVRADHADLAPRRRARLFARARHIVVSPRGSLSSPVETAFAAKGRPITVSVRVPHFTVAAHLAAGSDDVAWLPRALAERLAPRLGLAVREPPIEVPSFSLVMIFSEVRRRDPMHAFYRSLVLGSVGEPSRPARAAR